MNSRIKELRKILKLTQVEFSTQIGIRHSTLSDIERGNAPVTPRTLIAICSKFNVNEEWLKTGNGSIFVEEDKRFNDFYGIYKNLSKPLQEFLIKVCKDLLDTQNKL